MKSKTLLDTFGDTFETPLVLVIHLT